MDSYQNTFYAMNDTFLRKTLSHKSAIQACGMIHFGNIIQGNYMNVHFWKACLVFTYNNNENNLQEQLLRRNNIRIQMLRFLLVMKLYCIPLNVGQRQLRMATVQQNVTLIFLTVNNSKVKSTVKKIRTELSRMYVRIEESLVESAFYFKHGFLLLFLHNSPGTKEIPDCGNLVRQD